MYYVCEMQEMPDGIHSQTLKGRDHLGNKSGEWGDNIKMNIKKV
jgi:hypothetical protein